MAVAFCGNAPMAFPPNNVEPKTATSAVVLKNVFLLMCSPLI